ncbi:hypothetical protein CAMRE0001_1108 [Campylobacter rectus RM3267]|uniref:Uncharacterized protein n=1 Tax=Campylobacter rectus RM3267 TaxID=553218 RepID=B9D5J7_CAMRE|nr:hypothetical protein CAMRE0001_1108 [Campylobacter rectus RM3267]
MRFMRGRIWALRSVWAHYFFTVLGFFITQTTFEQRVKSRL